MIPYLFMTVVTIGWLAMLGMVLSMTPFSSHNPGMWWGELSFQIFLICLILALGIGVWFGWMEVLE